MTEMEFWPVALTIGAATGLAGSVLNYRLLRPGVPDRGRWLSPVVIALCVIGLASTVSERGWHAWVLAPTFVAIAVVQWMIFRGKPAAPTMQERWDAAIEDCLSEPHFGHEARKAREIGARMRHCLNNPRNGGAGFDTGDGTWRDRRTHR